MLHLFNTLSKQKEDFIPLKKNQVTIYSCGPTVYDYAHIGNLSYYISVDILKRYLQFSGKKVIDVMNITDVDDKTISNSNKNNQTLKQYTEKYTSLFIEDLKTLNITIPKYIPHATDHIKEMIEIIKKLEEKGFAYQADDKSVYFNISAYKNYGQLSGFDTTQLKVEASGRVKSDEYDKDNAADFVLWKAWDEADGAVKWDSPWGPGRPGWHIECSAMSMKYLGEQIDMHSGGEDLIFPHHENEIAQTEAITNKKFVNYWIHNAYLKVDGKKMSKSLGNFYTLQNILEKVPDPMAFRYLIATSHYKMPLNFTIESLRAADTALNKIRAFVERLNTASGDENINIMQIIDENKQKFIEAMDDDINTPNAIATWFDFQNIINKYLKDNKLSKKDAKTVLKYIKELDQIWGFMLSKKPEIKVDQEKIEELIKQRNKYRKEKNFQKSDKIRNELEKMGIEIQDAGDKTTWIIK